MGFLSHRRRDVKINPEQKWDFISLNDFKSTSFFTPLAYMFLWFSLFISLAVYAVDIFTAYQLLAYNKWSSQIEPDKFIIPFDVSKWIFTGCIILSFVNLAYEYLRAITIMRRGSVAECFLDSLAARIESTRLGSGRGWKRFLVFASLTDSKKGAEYIALFTFFSFQSWIRTILCSGPRQAVNGITLYSVYRAKLNINEATFESSLASFFDKIKALATAEPRQAVILCGMIFTLVVWVFSFLSLLLAAVFFVCYLWSYIPPEDGGLSGFCERKINKRLKQIVAKKINKAMAEEERQRKKAELKAAKKSGDDRPLTMRPSLPVLDDDSLPEMPSIKRADTFASFSEKPSRPNTPGSIEMNAMGRKPPMPMRSNTNLTTASQYSSNASLLNSAAEMGMAPSESSTPTLPPLDLDGYPPVRTATSASNRSYGQGPGGPQLQRMASNGSSLRNGYSASPAPFSSEAIPSLPPPVLSPVGPYNNYRGNGPNQPRERLPYLGDNRPVFDDNASGRASPAPTYRSNPMSPRGMGPDGYPIRSATNPVPPRGPPQFYPPRSMTQPSQSPFQQPPDSDNRSAANSVPPRGPPQMFPPPRSMTQPTLPFHHQPTDSNGRNTPQFSPARSMTQPTLPFHHQPTGSNGSASSMRSTPAPAPYHQPSASNSSLRNMVSAPALDRAEEGGGSEYGFVARPNPMTSGSRGPASAASSRGGYEGEDRWGRDLERGGAGGAGGGSRYQY